MKDQVNNQNMKTKLAISNKTLFRIIVVALILAFIGGIALIIIFNYHAVK